jgi:predicted nuclease with RNAse H fold
MRNLQRQHAQMECHRKSMRSLPYSNAQMERFFLRGMRIQSMLERQQLYSARLL